MKPTTIIIDGIIAYLASDIYAYDTQFFPGCSRIRNMIEKHNLTTNDYFFAYQKSDKSYVRSTSKYLKSKLFLDKEWVASHVPKMISNIKPNKQLYKYEQAPNLLILEEYEKFRDLNGNIIDIEMRGVREYDKCYFRVKSISETFGIYRLQSALNNPESKYELNIHYKLFDIENSINSIIDNDDEYTNKKSIDTIVIIGDDCSNKKRYLYLTYIGMLKVLFCSRSGMAESFQHWAAQKLFTIQMGTEMQRYGLATDLISINAKTIKDVFKLNTAKTPCVYLYLIGPAMLIGSDYDKNKLLCKYGCTDDIERRCQEHDKNFKKEFGTTIELLCFSIIESKYIFDAETNIRQYFKSDTIEYKTSKELVVIDKKDLSKIKQQYSMIQNSYIGRYELLISKVSMLEKDVITLGHDLKMKDYELKMKDKELELKDKEIELKDKEIELRDKDIRILNMQLN